MASKRQSSSFVGAQVMPPFKEFILNCLNYAPLLDKDDRALLERWLEHADVEKTWSTIRAHAEQHEGPIGADAPFCFIHFILKRKKAAERESELNVQIADIKAEVKESQKEFTQKVARRAKGLPFDKRAEFWKYAGKRLQGVPSAVIRPPRVRSDRDGSRARTYFIRDVSGLVHDLTGRWLDETVAVITDIAFDVAGTSIEAVRRARSN